MKRGTRLSPEDEAKREKAIALSKEGKTRNEIAELLKEPKKRITNWLYYVENQQPALAKSRKSKKPGVPHKKYTPEFKAEVIAKVTRPGVMAGRNPVPGNFPAIAKEYGVTPGMVRRWYMEAQRIGRRAKKAGVQIYSGVQMKAGPPKGTTKVILGEVEGNELERITRERDIFMEALGILLRERK